MAGGSASSAGGQGKAGGTAHLVSGGGITIGPDFQPPASAMAAAPADAMAIASAGLTADVTASGAISISGSVAAGGSDGVRRIVAGGDIFVSGSMRAADLGGARQGLTLEAPSGTIYVSGSIDTSGADGSGQAGGPLTLSAQRVVVAGKLLTAGGNASGAQAVTGGHGGDLSIQTSGDVVLTGIATLTGGGATTSSASTATGGDAGNFTIDATGVVALTGTFDLRGGSAKGGSPIGGAPGALKIGETTRPSAIGMTVPLVLKGGDGQATGGDGGAAKLEAHGGDLRISGQVDVSGGDSATKPGAGGTIDGNPGPDSTTAGIDIAGDVTANGGSITKGGAGDGAAGGTIKLVQLSADGTNTIEAGAQVQADGGGAAGAGTAGGGGLVYLYSIHGAASIHGTLFARGGANNDAGGTGGGGGFVYVFTGDGHDRMSGALIIETDGVIDASGGAGAVGGSARNDGNAGSVGDFPAVQDNEYIVYNIAVLINSDGVHGADHGYIDNRGQIIARGGKANGNGGDVAFHGRRQDGNETPLSGNVDNSADGAGMPGDFAGE